MKKFKVHYSDNKNTFWKVLEANSEKALYSVMRSYGFNVIFHVHDEIIVEADLFNGQDASGLEELMCRVPDWAKGMPLKAQAWREDPDHGNENDRLDSKKPNS